MYNLPTIIHNECGCILANDEHDDKCLKRTYQVYDVNENDYRNIRICNEYIRLRINNGDNYNDWHDKNWTATRIIEETISKYVTINDYERNEGNDLFDINVSYTVCERPYIYSQLTMKEAIEISLDGNRIISERTFGFIRQYINNLRFLKYKTRYEKLSRLINSIEKEFHKDKKVIKMNELLMELINIKIKFNI